MSRQIISPGASPDLSPRKKQTRQEIIDATRALLKAASYGSITVERILSEAAVSRRTFYSYFSDKNEVIRAVVEEIWQSAATLYSSFADISVINATNIHSWLRRFMVEWGKKKDEISSLIPLMHEDPWHDAGANARSNAAAMVGDGRHWNCSLHEARVRAYLLASQCDRAMSDLHRNRLSIGADELLDVLTDAWLQQLRPHVCVNARPT